MRLLCFSYFFWHPDFQRLKTQRKSSQLLLGISFPLNPFIFGNFWQIIKITKNFSMLHISLVSLKTVAISLKRLFYIYGSPLHLGMPVYQKENNKRHICWNIYCNICFSIFWFFLKHIQITSITYIHTNFYIHTYTHEMVCLVKLVFLW